MLLLIPLAAVFHNPDHSAWRDMFIMTIPWGEKILRSVLVYGFLLLGIRVAGKRELAQLNPFDLIVLLLLSNTVQNAIIGDDNTITGGMLGASMLLVLNYGLVRFFHAHRRLERLFEGSPEVLVKDGHVNTKALNRELITRQELLAAAHAQGISSLHEVHRAILESTGTISFIEARPTSEQSRHEELTRLLAKVLAEVAELKASKNAGGSGAT